MNRWIFAAALVFGLLILSLLLSPVQAHHESLQTDLVAYWHLDESSGTRVDEINGYDLTDNNTTGSTTGKINDAALFIKANSEFLGKPDTADLSGGDRDMTWSAWIYIESDQDGWILSKWLGDNAYKLVYEAGGNNIEWRLSDDCNDSGSTILEEVVSTNTWYHVVMWHDADNDLSGLQVNNGTPQTTAHTGGICNGTAGFRLSTSGTTFDGRIDDVAVWHRLLTADEIEILWNDGNGQDILEEHATPTPSPTPGGTPTPLSIYTHTLSSDHQLVVDLTADFGEVILAGVLITLVTLFVVVVLVRSKPS